MGRGASTPEQVREAPGTAPMTTLPMKQAGKKHILALLVRGLQAEPEHP